jgi:serine/threonine protein kinase
MGWSDLIGRQLSHYRLVGELGRGGSSRVYRGQDLEFDREVAIKVIFNDAEDRIGFVRRFEREVQAIAQLDHPNIVAVYDRGETDDLVYLVMQCVTGGTLRQRCGRPVPVVDAAAAIFQMGQALHHAHQNGIIHRDVKPSNMLVDAEDPRHVLLTDFGIAKLQGILGLTKSGTTIGTPEYMSPEQAEGKDIDQRTDVYALGCVLYELLAGRPPFVGSTSVSVLYQQVHVRPPHLRAFNAEVPREVSRIVEQALAKRPEERFGTAALLAEALFPFAQGQLPPLSNFEGLGPVPRRSVSGPLLRDIAPTGPLTPRPLPLVTPITSIPPGDSLPPAEATPSATGEAELAEPAPETWEGLGQEGLDAIFPHDPEARPSHEARLDIISNTPTLEELPKMSGPLPTQRESSSRSIPLPAFHLPSRTTRPLNLPITPNGQLDFEALLAQIEASTLRATAGSGTALRTEGTPAVVETPADPEHHSLDIPDYDTDELEVASGQASRDRRRKPSPSLPGLGKWRSGGSGGAFIFTSQPPRRRLAVVASALAILLAIAVIAGVLLTANLLSHGNRGKSTHHAPTPTVQQVLPSPTATMPTRATATVNIQQVINHEAAASFNSVILSSFADNSCSAVNSTRQFSSGQDIYVDLCTSTGPFPGPATVTIRQAGTILYILASQIYLSPSSSYYFFRYGLAAGTYDMVVTMPVNGRIAVAWDLVFYVS